MDPSHLGTCTDFGNDPLATHNLETTHVLKYPLTAQTQQRHRIDLHTLTLQVPPHGCMSGLDGADVCGADGGVQQQDMFEEWGVPVLEFIDHSGRPRIQETALRIWQAQFLSPFQGGAHTGRS